MANRDLRTCINEFEEAGELHRIKAEVDWNLELGAITRQVLTKGDDAPALLFENIKGYKNKRCRKVFTNGLGSFRRCAMALGLSKDTPPGETLRFIKDKFQQSKKPRIVGSGPVKENIIKGNEINLNDFPVPKWNHLDGGRFISTYNLVITRDPETGTHNVGLYRGQISGPRSIPMMIALTQHWGTHFSKHARAKNPMPVALAIGVDEALLMVAPAPIVHLRGSSEYDVAGALLGKPVEITKCETSDIMVPANAEIVIEGKISPDPATFEMEGPFGEYPGYFGGLKSPKPTLKVDCITHRDDPIFVGALEGNSPGRPATSRCVTATAMWAAAWAGLEQAGVPGVLDLWGGVTSVGTVMKVRIRKQYRGHAKQVAMALWGSPASQYYAKFLIVVDEDIDIHDDDAVNWAMAYRCNPEMNGIISVPGLVGSMLDPSVPLEKRNVPKYGQGQWTKVLIDATINWDLEPEAQFGGQRYPPLCTTIEPTVEKLIKKRWKEYGFA